MSTDTSRGAGQRSGVRILIYVVGLVLVGAASYGVIHFTGDSVEEIKAGDCAEMTGPAAAPTFRTVDCAAPEAGYIVGRVLSTLENSCGGAYDTYHPAAIDGQQIRLCMVPNLVEGACYDSMPVDHMGWTKVDCTETTPKLLRKVEGLDDGTGCGDSTGLISEYPENKLTFCFGSHRST